MTTELDRSRAGLAGPADTAAMPHEAFSAMGDLVVVLRPVRDAQGRLVDEEIVFANPAWRRTFLAADAPDPTGARLLAVAPALGARLPLHDQVMQTGQEHRGVFTLPDRRGWFDVGIVKFGDGVLVLTRDVTEAQAAREALATRETELAEAQRIAHVGSWRSRADTGEVVWSDELYRILGAEPRDGSLAHDQQAEVLDPATFALRNGYVAELLRTGQPFSVEAPITRPDGTVAGSSRAVRRCATRLARLWAHGGPSRMSPRRGRLRRRSARARTASG